MKFKTTKKAMRDSNQTIISIGYCDAQYLLRHENPVAYSAGVNGWACDYYLIDNVCISTGYNPIGKFVDYDTIKSYESKAAETVHNNNISYEDQKNQVTALLNQFINEVA